MAVMELNPKFQPMTERELFSHNNRFYVVCEVAKEIYELTEHMADEALKEAIRRKVLLSCSMVRTIMKKIREQDPLWVLQNFDQTKDIK